MSEGILFEQSLPYLLPNVVAFHVLFNGMPFIASCTTSFNAAGFFNTTRYYHILKTTNDYFHQQIKALHLYDCLRANKSTSAWGLEARVPFLDKEFISIAMSIDPEWKMVKHFDIYDNFVVGELCYLSNPTI